MIQYQTCPHSSADLNVNHVLYPLSSAKIPFTECPRVGIVFHEGRYFEGVRYSFGEDDSIPFWDMVRMQHSGAVFVDRSSEADSNSRYLVFYPTTL